MGCTQLPHTWGWGRSSNALERSVPIFLARLPIDAVEHVDAAGVVVVKQDDRAVQVKLYRWRRCSQSCTHVAEKGRPVRYCPHGIKGFSFCRANAA